MECEGVLIFETTEAELEKFKSGKIAKVNGKVKFNNREGGKNGNTKKNN